MEILANGDVDASTWGDAWPQAGRALSAEIDAARADLERLNALLADAVATLVESFGAVRALGEGREEFAIPLGRAATALQFQDLASQLIGHTRGRLDDMTGIGEAFDGLGAALAAGKAPAVALAEAGARLALCTRAMLANNPRQPVRQHQLGEGSIDLF